MLIVWDEPKRLANLAKHDLDFSDVEDAFDFETALALSASPGAQGRPRIKLIGWMFEKWIVAMIVSPLGSEALSIVSLRFASSRERKDYGAR